MTEKQLADGFSAFMPGDYGARLATAMCTPQQPVTVIDDEANTMPEDGSAFAADGTFLPGTARTPAQQHVRDYYYGDDTMLTLPGCATLHQWMKRMTDAAGVSSILPDVPRPVREIALAVCAVTKAFPADAESVINEHIINNPLYGPFWPEARVAFAALLPDSLKGGC